MSAIHRISFLQPLARGFDQHLKPLAPYNLPAIGSLCTHPPTDSGVGEHFQTQRRITLCERAAMCLAAVDQFNETSKPTHVHTLEQQDITGAHHRVDRYRLHIHHDRRMSTATPQSHSVSIVHAREAPSCQGSGSGQTAIIAQNGRKRS